MEIATNAVLMAMLLQASDLVQKLEMPLQTPLQATNVATFRTRPVFGPEASASLSCYLEYKGGYEFWLRAGRINAFCTPDSYGKTHDGRRLSGEARFSEAECLAKVKDTVRKLGYTNVTLLDSAPKIAPPFVALGRRIPRYFIEWWRPAEREGWQPDLIADAEVNAQRLTIERLNLFDLKFSGEPWPVTFGQTNVALPERPAEPKRTDLELKGVTRPYAMAYIRAILPEINAFCSKLGMALPNPIVETNILMGESGVAMIQGRPLATLGLNTGYQIIFYKGHVGRVQARDSSFNSPWRDEKYRRSEEYLGSIRFSKSEVAEKVRRLLVDQLRLPVKPLFLDTDPVFHLVPNNRSTKGVRVYYFTWQRPASDGQRQNDEVSSFAPELSISAEVNAVSCEIKMLTFWHESLERPDPDIAALQEAAGGVQALSKTNEIRQ